MLRFSTLFRFFFIVGLTVSVVGATGSATAKTPPSPKTITITPDGNKMKFTETEITAQAGQTVTIIFKNTATSPAMQHNVVVLNTSDASAIKRVGQAALSAPNYVPDDPAVLAATDVAKPGETTEVTFTAPEAPGQYRYICTFPGHYQSMQGTLIVEE